MTSAGGQPINLQKILEHENANIHKISGNSRRSGIDNSSNHHSKAKLNLEFPVVVTLARIRLDAKSRSLMENFKQLQLTSSLPSQPSSSSSQSSSSSSQLYDSGALIMIMNDLNIQSATVQQNQLNNNNHHHRFVIENVGHVDLLFGEELHRKSSDGSLASTGRKLEIPKNFEGWFEILSQDGRSSQQITDVTTLVKKKVKHFLLTKPIKGLGLCRNHTAINSDLGPSTAIGDYKQVMLSVGHELHCLQVVLLSDGLRYLSCKLKQFKKYDAASRKEVNDKRDDDVVLLPLTGQGRFLPISRDSNLTDAHDASFLMSKLYSPLVVKMYWTPGSRNIPPPNIRNGSAKVKDIKKIGFFQKRSNSSPRIEPPAPSATNCEYMTSTIVRIHGHARQKVLYMAPMSIPHEGGGVASAVDVSGDLKVVALRSQACKLFDVTLETNLKTKTDILENLKKKKYILQSAFEREVKIFDPTLYKMTGEKLTVSKQPINFSKENEVTNQGQAFENVEFRQHDVNHKENVDKRRSLPLDVTLERRDDVIKSGGHKDDESVLMNEIENIYMRVRYWDRSVRYPMPQKSTPIPQQQQQQQQHHNLQIKLQQQGLPLKSKQTMNLYRQQNISEVPLDKREPPIPRRSQQQQQQRIHTQPPLPPTPPLPRHTTTLISDPPVIDCIEDIQPTNDIKIEESSIANVTASAVVASIPTTAVVSTSLNTTNPMATPNNNNNNNKDLKGAVINAFRNLVKKHRGSMDVAKLAGDEFSYFKIPREKPQT